MTYHGDYIIIGPPGTGKTHRIAKSVERIVQQGRRPIVCSLTRAAAAEAAGRNMPLPSDQIGTLHRFSYQAIRDEVCRVRVATGSALRGWNDVCSRFDHRFQVSVTQGDLDELDPDPFATETVGDRTAARYHVLRHRMVPRQKWPDEVRKFAAAWEDWKLQSGLIDFTDMIEMTYHEAAVAPSEPDVVIVDEAQDLSMLEYSLIRKWGKAAGACICVGDPWQALYVWRGAHVELFDDPAVPESHRDLLTQSYRVLRSVHALASGWIEQLSNWKPNAYRSTDTEGDVIMHPTRWTAPEFLMSDIEQWAQDGSVMIMASCSFMLRPLIAVLRNYVLPFSIPWRRKRRDWNPLDSTMTNSVLSVVTPLIGTHGRRRHPWNLGQMSRWVSSVQSDGVLRSGSKKKIAGMGKEAERSSHTNLRLDSSMLDRFFVHDTVEFLERMLGTGSRKPLSMEEALDWFENRLSPSKRRSAAFPLRIARERGVEALSLEPRIHVGTIHSFKGGEADTVIVYPDLSASGDSRWVGRGDERDAMVRLFYVAMTRTRNRLAICQQVSPRAVMLW